MREGMFLNAWSAWSLLAYFVLVIFVATRLWWGEFMPPLIDHSEVHVDRGVLTAASAAAIVSSLFYARKLYKDLFAIDAGGALNLSRSHIATIFYFAMRPLFAVAIAAIIALGTYGFVHAVSEAPVTLSSGFLIFVTLAGALCSAITGAAVRHIEGMAAETLKLIRPPG